MKKALLFLVCIIGFYPMYAQLLNMGQQSADQKDSTSAIIFTVVEEMPEYPGGDEAMRKFIADHLIYPKSAMESAISGTVYVTFVVDYTGKVRDVKILRGIGGGCDEEVIRIIQNMPDWKPGKQFGKPVNVQFNLPVKFSLNDNDLKDTHGKNVNLDSSSNICLKRIEEQPEFIGGDRELMKFIETNFKYPYLAKEVGIQGTVYVSFIIEETGKVTNVKLLRGIGGGCDEEAIRIVQMMPDWKPGKLNGTPVRVQFNLPIKFILN